SPRVRGSRAASVCGHAAEATTRKTEIRLDAMTSNASRTRSRAPNLHTTEPHVPRRRDLKRASHPQPGPATAAPGRASGEQNEQNAHSEHKRAIDRLRRLR